MATRQKTVIPLMDLTGMTIGYWYIKGPAPPRRDSRGRLNVKMWNCVCKCGVEREVRDSELRRFGSTSCGCFNIEITLTQPVDHKKNKYKGEMKHGNSVTESQTYSG